VPEVGDDGLLPRGALLEVADGGEGLELLPTLDVGLTALVLDLLEDLVVRINLLHVEKTENRDELISVKRTV